MEEKIKIIQTGIEIKLSHFLKQNANIIEHKTQINKSYKEESHEMNGRKQK
jgi:hypothetical protein